MMLGLAKLVKMPWNSQLSTCLAKFQVAIYAHEPTNWKWTSGVGRFRGYDPRQWQGPFAVLDPNDFPAVLAHAETQAHALGAESVGFEVPLINKIVVDYLLGRGYKLD